MTYSEIMHYLKNTEKIGSIYGLERIEKLLDFLNHPEKNLKIIHTAGTNGKGSTNAFINHALIEHGYSTFSYVSPALNDYLEKFLLNGNLVLKDSFVLAMNEVIQASQKLEKTTLGHPTIFEMEMACAYLIAKNEAIDFFIQETGLGGRLDATNTIKTPLICVITSISKDHLGLLGTTLEEIAYEKAGIIKPDAPVILYDNQELNCIFTKIAEEKNAPYILCDFSQIEYIEKDEQIILHVENESYPLGLKGKHQAKNAYVALQALFYLKKLGYNITREKIKVAFTKTYWPGRFEKISNAPIIYLDGAHNEDSVNTLIDNLKHYHPLAKHIFVLHIFEDKDSATMLEKLDFANEMICTSLNLPRSLSANALFEKARQALPNQKIIKEDNFDRALDKAITLAKNDKTSVITIFGSLSHLEKARQYLLGENQ